MKSNNRRDNKWLTVNPLDWTGGLAARIAESDDNAGAVEAEVKIVMRRKLGSLQGDWAAGVLMASVLLHAETLRSLAQGLGQSVVEVVAAMSENRTSPHDDPSLGGGAD